MTTITAQQLQQDPEAFLARVEAGEQLIIMREGRAIAVMAPTSPDPGREGMRPFGLAAGQAVVSDDLDDPLPEFPNGLRPCGLAKGEFVVPDDFDDPLPDDLLDLFEGR